MLESVYQEFNKDLANDDMIYDIKEYMNQIKLRFSINVDLKLYDNSNSKTNEFLITEDMAPNGIDIRKILKSNNFKNGIDYIVVHIGHKKHWFSSNTQYRMTGAALKKCLLMSGEEEYINYFLFLDEIVRNYYHYQKIYERKTILESKKKIENLEKLVSSSRAIEFEDF